MAIRVSMGRIMLYLLFLMSLWGIGLLFWSLCVEPRRLEITTLKVELPEWNEAPSPARIVALADLHARPGERGERRLRAIVDATLKLRPEAVVLLGDYVNGRGPDQTMPPEDIARLLRPLAEHCRAYYVLGNHDHYYGAMAVHAAFMREGFIPLEGDSATLRFRNGKTLQISGVRDDYSYEVKPVHIPARRVPGVPQLIITHSPGLYPHLKPSVNLVLAGHTHGGQICLPGGFPLAPPPLRCNWAMTRGGPYRDGGGPLMYVSRGLGTTYLPIRLFCPPELLCIDLQ